MNLILLAIGGWALAMVFVLALLGMSSKEDRAARDEATEVAVRLFTLRFQPRADWMILHPSAVDAETRPDRLVT